MRLVKAPKETKSKTFEAFREAPTINHDMMFFLAMKAYNNISTRKRLTKNESNLEILFLMAHAEVAFLVKGLRMK